MTANGREEVAVLMDTGSLLRELAMNLFSNELDLLRLAHALEYELWLAPHQEHEVRRNARQVYAQTLQGVRSEMSNGLRAINAGVKRLKDFSSLAALDADLASVRDAHQRIKAASDKFWREAPTWHDFEERVRKLISRSQQPDKEVAEAIEAQSRQRAVLGNPPATFSAEPLEKHFGDCRVWQTVLDLLRRGYRVYFATTDRHFQYQGPDALKGKRELHPYLQSEVEALPGKLTPVWQDSHPPISERLYDRLHRHSLDPAVAGRVRYIRRLQEYDSMDGGGRVTDLNHERRLRWLEVHERASAIRRRLQEIPWETDYLYEQSEERIEKGEDPDLVHHEQQQRDDELEREEEALTLELASLEDELYRTCFPIDEVVSVPED